MKKYLLKVLTIVCLVLSFAMIPQDRAFAESEKNIAEEDNIEQKKADRAVKWFSDTQTEIKQNQEKYIYLSYSRPATEGTPVYSVDNPEVAEVIRQNSSDIKIKGKKAGETILRVSTSAGEFTHKIIVPKSFYFENSSVTVKLGAEKIISLSTDFNQYTWTNSNPEVADWDRDVYQSSYKRTILTKKTGTTTIKVTNEFGEVAKITVKVEKVPFKFEKSTYSVWVGYEESIELPEPYSWENCTYTIKNTEIASLQKDNYDAQEAEIKGLKPGDTTLTVKNQFGDTATCKIHAFKSIYDLSFKQDSKTVYLGRKYTLGYTTNPTNTNNKITYYVPDAYKSYISVTQKGVITPKKATRKYERVRVCIKSECGEDDYISITIKKPYFSKSEYSVYRKKTIKLASKLTGESASTTWSSSNTKIATVNKSGVVTGKKAGTVTITANSGGCKIKTKVVVSNPKISKKTTSIYAGNTVKLKITGGTGTVKWSSSKTSVATVDKNGKVTAKKAGTATITAKVSGVSLKCKVTVKAPKLSKTSKKLVARQTFTLKLTGGAGKKVWKSSNTSVATVNQNGKITAKKAGTATISVKVSGVTLKCKVTVIANQKKYSVNTEATRYDYGSPTLVLSKVYYSGSKLKADVWVMNNRAFRADEFDWLDYTIYDNNGNVIADKTFNNVKLGIKPYGSKKITLTFSGSSLKKKNAILNNGVDERYEFWYWYSY